MKIMFVSEKSLSECNPELVEKLLNATSIEDVIELEEECEGKYEEIVDTMFAIVKEKRIKNYSLNDKAVTEWLNKCFLGYILDDLELEFAEAISKKRLQKKN